MESLGLLFSGQGAQIVGMGRSIAESSAQARELWDKAQAVLGYDLSNICFKGPEAELTQTKVCQAALFVHGFIIYKELEKAGKLTNLKVALGSSLGELTALAAAGVWDFETGLRVVEKRATLMQAACEKTSGGMLALIGGDDATVKAFAERFSLDISNYNSPGQTVISGDLASINAAAAVAKESGFKMSVKLNVAGAYHSRLMELARTQFEAYLKDVDFEKPRIAVLSNARAIVLSELNDIRAALVEQIVAPVRWVECMRAAMLIGVNHYYECGPQAVLAGLARRIDKSLTVTGMNEAQDILNS
jgi:[acyl-carrier-protein] S-malonyltransferase